MAKNIANEQIFQNNYLNFITSTLSSYEVKEILSDGTVKTRIIMDDYFLINDVWNVNDFERFPYYVEQVKNYKKNRKNLYFITDKQAITLELKFIYYHMIFSKQLKLNTLFGDYATPLNSFIQFLHEKYSHLSSLLDLNLDKSAKEWILWLKNKNIKITKKVKILHHEYEYGTTISTFFRNIYEILINKIDNRELWEKDKWCFRELNKNYGIQYNDTLTDPNINFSCIQNKVFKNSLKKYIKTRLLGGKGFAVGTARNYQVYVSYFLNFISKIEPEWNDLKGLTRQHIEKYLEYIHTYTKNNLKNSNRSPKSYVMKCVSMANYFLKDIQRFEYSIAPKISSSKLFYSEDYPKLGCYLGDDIKYIPDYVLEQLFEHLNELHPDVQPIVWISFKTGLRISDTLGLTQNCLIQLNGKYSIQTDIEKTYVKGHKIPIDNQLANLVAVLIHKSKELSNDDNNPNKYIFTRYSGTRKGRPYSQGWIRNKLNELAFKKNITDEMGNIFHFKTHQFRHTYAVKMLNGGADILTVQELLAHASPEMTMRYAKLLDNTKRKAFEEAIKQGVFSFDLNGEVQEVKPNEDIPTDILETLWQDQKLYAIDNPYGTCHARINGNCPYAEEPPCLTCNGGSPCKDLAIGFSELDKQKYELLIKTTTKTVEAFEKRGREEIVEKNKKNLERYQNILNTIEDGNIIFGRLERLKRKQGITND